MVLSVSMETFFLMCGDFLLFVVNVFPYDCGLFNVFFSIVPFWRGI